MNIVAIDPSLISTALIVGRGDDFKIFNYCREDKVMGKKGMTKWYKLAEEVINYRYVNYRKYDGYSDGELVKLKDYDGVTDMIISDILDNIDEKLETKVIIEGYNFGSKMGDILDLVTFSTLLRKKLFDRVSEDIIVVSPTTLKLESCKLTYPPIEKELGVRKKTIKVEWRNNFGIPGGNFTKREMYSAIIDNNEYGDKWIKHCKSVSGDILGVSTIPKPHEDCSDAWLLYRILPKLI